MDIDGLYQGPDCFGTLLNALSKRISDLFVKNDLRMFLLHNADLTFVRLQLLPREILGHNEILAN